MVSTSYVCQLVLLLVAKRVSTQSCYSCDSCGDDPFSTVGATTVSCSSNLCYTTKSTVTLLGITSTNVIRGCAVNVTATGCVAGSSFLAVSAVTCTCSGDKCNSGPADGTALSTQSCYSCSNCGDGPFSTVGAATMSCNSDLCHTTKVTANVNGVPTTIVSRGCAYTGNATGCVTLGAGLDGVSGGYGTLCTCSGNKCNSGAAPASATSCYSCSNCGDDPFSTSSASTVSCSTNLCYKTKATGTLLGVSTTTFSRGCATAGTSIGCVSGGAGVGNLVSGSGTTCTCSGEKCNTGTVNVSSIVAIAMSLCVALIFL